MCHRRGGMWWPWNVVWLVFLSWVISCANEFENHSNSWGTTHSLVFWFSSVQSHSLLYSKGTQLYIYIYPLFCGFPSHLGHQKVVEFPVLLVYQLSILSLQFSSVAQSCLTLCDPMDCSRPGLLVYHQLLDFTQTHVHWASDTIQPSHPLLYPSLPAFNLSQHQGLFKWVSSSHQVAKVLEFLLQHQSFQWIFRTDLL